MLKRGAMGIGSVWLLMGVGCNIHQSPEKETTKKGIRIPQKISVELRGVSSSARSIDKLTAGHDEITHDSFLEGDVENLRLYVGFLEHTINELKFNNFLGNRVIERVEHLCEDIPINEVCTLPANSLSLIVDRELIEAYEGFFNESFDRQRNPLGKRLFYDTIVLIKQEGYPPYEYDIQLDLTQISKALYQKNLFDLRDRVMIHNVKWSKDENHVLSTITHTFINGVTYYWTIHYDAKAYTDDQVVERMHLFDRLDGGIWAPSSMVNADFIDWHDASFTQSFRYNEITKENHLSSYVAYSDLTNQYGFRRSVREQFDPEFDYFKIKKDEIFYNYGKELIASRSCDEREVALCDFDDTTTWESKEENESIFSFINRDKFEALRIEGGVLEEGEYFLLPPEYNLSNLHDDMVIEEAVGMFVLFDNWARGALYDRHYTNQLEELILVYAGYNDHLNRIEIGISSEVFHIIPKESRPEITLFP